MVLEPNPDNVTHARTKLYGKSLDKLVIVWKNARDLEIKIKDCMKDIEKIPSQESRVIDWWNMKPDMIIVDEGTEKTQDKLGLPNSKHELYKILSSITAVP